MSSEVPAVVEVFLRRRQNPLGPSIGFSSRKEFPRNSPLSCFFFKVRIPVSPGVPVPVYASTPRSPLVKVFLFISLAFLSSFSTFPIFSGNYIVRLVCVFFLRIFFPSFFLGIPLSFFLLLKTRLGPLKIQGLREPFLLIRSLPVFAISPREVSPSSAGPANFSSPESAIFGASGSNFLDFSEVFRPHPPSNVAPWRIPIFFDWTFLILSCSVFPYIAVAL